MMTLTITISAKATTIIFLALTLFLYVLINELKSNLHGKFVIGFLFSLILATGFTRTGYSATDFVTILALILAFLWINVMIFDVWWILR